MEKIISRTIKKKHNYNGNEIVEYDPEDNLPLFGVHMTDVNGYTVMFWVNNRPHAEFLIDATMVGPVYIIPTESKDIEIAIDPSVMS